jgi:putative membrane protein
MGQLATALVALVGALHAYFMWLEMFMWSKPFGRRVFRLTPERAEMSRVLAANQGLYNGFLAAGLFWAAVAPPPLMFPLRAFFLSCVIVAGLYGWLSTSRAILYAQAIPGAVALAVAFAAR